VSSFPTATFLKDDCLTNPLLRVSQSHSYFTTGGLPPISSSWRRAPWYSRPDFFLSIEHLRSYSLYNIFSDDRMGLSFTIAAGPRQRIHSQIRVPWDSKPYFTVSESRLPFCRLLRRAGYGGGIRPGLHTRFSLAFSRVLPFLTSGEPNRDHHLEHLVAIMCVVTEMCLPNRWLAMDSFLAIRCSVNVITESLPSNGHIRHNI
jgi:hypothetical protein